MKNQVIATLVAGVIILIWQFLSWSLLPVHKSEMQYTDKQDAILQNLSQQQLSEGTYYLPQAAPGSTPEQAQAYYDGMTGKPWAIVSYRSALTTNMGLNMFRGFVVDLLAAFLLVWLLRKMSKLDFSTALLASLAVGSIGYLTIPYLNTIWFEGSSLGYLVDLVVQWGLVGAWLGWYLTRKQVFLDSNSRH